MKLLKYVIAIIAFAFVSNACVADYEAVLNANFKARGGENIFKMKTLKMDCKAKTMVGDMPFTYYFGGEKKFAVFAKVMGQQMKFVQNGDVAFMDMAGMTQDIPKEKLHLMSTQYPQSFVYDRSPLSDPSLATPENTSISKKSYKGNEYTVLTIKASDELEFDYYIDPKTNLELAIGIVSRKNTKAKQNDLIMEISDWVEVEGIKFATKMQMEANGVKTTIITKNIEVNANVEESIFKK